MAFEAQTLEVGAEAAVFTSGSSSLPLTGPISIQDILNELANGGITPADASFNDPDFRELAGVPSGPISFDDFRGKSSVLTINFEGNLGPINLRDYVNANVPNGASYTGKVNVNIVSGSIIRGDTAPYAFETGSGFAEVNLFIGTGARIVGYGGDGAFGSKLTSLGFSNDPENFLYDMIQRGGVKGGAVGQNGQSVKRALLGSSNFVETGGGGKGGSALLVTDPANTYVSGNGSIQAGGGGGGAGAVAIVNVSGSAVFAGPSAAGGGGRGANLSNGRGGAAGAPTSLSHPYVITNATSASSGSTTDSGDGGSGGEGLNKSSTWRGFTFNNNGGAANGEAGKCSGTLTSTVPSGVYLGIGGGAGAGGGAGQGGGGGAGSITATAGQVSQALGDAAGVNGSSNGFGGRSNIIVDGNLLTGYFASGGGGGGSGYAVLNYNAANFSGVTVTGPTRTQAQTDNSLWSVIMPASLSLDLLFGKTYNSIFFSRYNTTTLSQLAMFYDAEENVGGLLFPKQGYTALTGSTSFYIDLDAYEFRVTATNYVDGTSMLVPLPASGAGAGDRLTLNTPSQWYSCRSLVDSGYTPEHLRAKGVTFTLEVRNKANPSNTDSTVVTVANT